MIGFALFLAMFPAMFYTARQRQTSEQCAAALAVLEAPVTKAELEDWFWLLLSWLVALALWPFKLLWRLFCLPYADYLERFTQWVCARLGAGLPESTLPEWKVKEVKPFKILVDEYIEEDGGNFVVYDGVSYSGRFAGEKKEIGITRAEMDALKNYDPPLSNASLAGKVKTHVAASKSDYEMAVLTGYAETTVKHYRLALEKAKKNI